MHIGAGVILQPDAAGLGRRVVGAGQQGGEGDHIQVVRPAVKGLQVLHGGGAGGLGSGLTLLHPPQQLSLIKGVVIHDGVVAHPDGQRHLDKALLPELGRRQIAAAVDNDLERHRKNPLIS